MGRMVVIEGLDGSGKSTQAQLLKNRLKEMGYETFSLDLPYYSDPSSTLVKMYLGGKFGTNANDVNPYMASAFFAVDRVGSIKCEWADRLNSADVVIADRYVTSNMIHQASKI